MATLAALRTRVQENLGEPISDSGWHVSSAINDFINAGINMIFLKIMAVNSEFYGVNTTTLSFVNGTQEYSLASVDPFEVRLVEITDQSNPYFLEETRLSEKSRYGQDGEPIAYYWFVDYSGSSPILKIGFFPKPDRTATNNVKVYYAPKPATLSVDTNSPDLPVEFHELIVVWATMLALRSDRRFNDADYYFQEFNSRMANLLSFATRGKAGGPTYVNYTESY